MSLPAVKTGKSPQVPSKQSRQRRISTQIRTAIDAMVWQGLTRDDAAKAAGILDNSLYKALRRPDVKAAYLAELDVLRTSERARNIHALVDVRDSKTNQMATVAAVKALEQMSDVPGANNAGAASPGVVIQIINATVPAISGPAPSEIKMIGADGD